MISEKEEANPRRFSRHSNNFGVEDAENRPRLGVRMTFLVLMLIPFGLVLGVGVFFVWLISRQASQRRNHVRIGSFPWVGFGAPGSQDIRPLLCSQLGRWVAIRSRNLAAVQTALGLHNPIPCSWTEGMVQAGDRKLFLSPPVNGWILVIGPRLPDPADDIDACFRFLNRLSRELGEVQFFSVNRVVGHHAWARFDSGQVFRGYAWAGETLWNQGPKTWAERKLGLKCFDYFEGARESHFETLEQARANVERVMLLAAIWSIDPTSVDDSMLTDARGVAGELFRLRLH